MARAGPNPVESNGADSASQKQSTILAALLAQVISNGSVARPSRDKLPPAIAVYHVIMQDGQNMYVVEYGLGVCSMKIDPRAEAR
eukprot:scaffold1868_cov178-Amphora_coffeaeformis.AAC.3